jgi:DNA-binding LacI/PurR family transcriptional regulator
VRQPTIRDVAEKAGVSKSLVSLVINNSPRVSDKSRQAVLTAASELGYRRNATARSLVSRQSQTIGVVMSSTHEPFSSEALDGVDQLIASEGYRAFVQLGRHDRSAERQAIESFLEIRVDALILLGNELPTRELEELSRVVPIGLVGRHIESSIIDVVAKDEQLGSTLAVEHLMDLGHRAIAHIDGGTGLAFRDRASGYRQAMRAHDLEPHVISGETLADGGAVGPEALLNKAGNLPTAILASSDLAAFGVRDALQMHGLRIPQDVSLVGYNDTHLGRLLYQGLTTISQPGREMGMQAAGLVMARLRDADRPAQNVVVPPSLIVRQSTAPPPAPGH